MLDESIEVPRIDIPEGDDVQGLLKDAFEAFNQATEQLRSSYVELKKEVKKLNIELEEKNLEIKRFEEILERKNRLAAMGEMAAGVAHEVRNPLGSIELFLSVLKREIDGNKKALELADHISMGVKSLDNIVSNLLQFTRSPEPSFKLIDIHKVIDDSCFTYLPLIKQSSVTLKKDFSDSLPEVLGDDELLKQVFLNVIINAVQAMPHGGVLNIKTRVRRKAVEIILEDTGEGISPDEMKRIFNPFFTTKKRGMGLGLAIAHNIVEAHSGAVDIKKSTEKGTRLKISLPIHGEG